MCKGEHSIRRALWLTVLSRPHLYAIMFGLLAIFPAFYVWLVMVSSYFRISQSADLVDEAAKASVPKQPFGIKTLTSSNNVTIRYKEPGKDGICEITPGVNSYSGYVDLDEDTHMFFWFFEARRDANTAPITLWLNGGPGSDSLIGLFEGIFIYYII